MATTITTIGLPTKITLGTSNLATKVTLPGVLRATLYFETNAGKYSNAGTDGQAIGDNYEVVPLDTPYDLLLDSQEHGNPPVIYLASATGSTVVRVTAKMR